MFSCFDFAALQLLVLTPSSSNKPLQDALCLTFSGEKQNCYIFIRQFLAYFLIQINLYRTHCVSPFKGKKQNCYIFIRQFLAYFLMQKSKKSCTLLKTQLKIKKISFACNSRKSWDIFLKISNGSEFVRF